MEWGVKLFALDYKQAFVDTAVLALGIYNTGDLQSAQAQKYESDCENPAWTYYEKHQQLP
jgi:hypothetical protein